MSFTSTNALSNLCGESPIDDLMFFGKIPEGVSRNHWDTMMSLFCSEEHLNYIIGFFNTPVYIDIIGYDISNDEYTIIAKPNKYERKHINVGNKTYTVRPYLSSTKVDETIIPIMINYFVIEIDR